MKEVKRIALLTMIVYGNLSAAPISFKTFDDLAKNSLTGSRKRRR